jgi:hypothetical protein
MRVFGRAATSSRREGDESTVHFTRWLRRAAHSEHVHEGLGYACGQRGLVAGRAVTIVLLCLYLRRLEIHLQLAMSKGALGTFHLLVAVFDPDEVWSSLTTLIMTKDDSSGERLRIPHGHRRYRRLPHHCHRSRH